MSSTERGNVVNSSDGFASTASTDADSDDPERARKRAPDAGGARREGAAPQQERNVVSEQYGR